MRYCLVSKTVCFALVALATFVGSPLYSQGIGSRVEVSDTSDHVEIIVGSSRRLTFPYDIPEVLVENPEIVGAAAIATNEIVVRGLKSGITTLSVMNPSRELQTVTIQVVVDVRKLEHAIKTHYPSSNISVHALQNGVLLKGTVAKQAQLTNIMLVAQDYFPTNVVNEIRVAGAQLVAIKVKIYEVSRTKLRSMGIDWAINTDDVSIISSVADLIAASTAGVRPSASGQNFTAGVVNNGNSFDAFFEAIEQRNVAKLMTEPVLVAEHGRPSEFLSGGEIPIPVASGLGTSTIEFRPFGTKLDIVPLIQGQGEIKLEVRAEVSEQAGDLSNGTNVPGFRVRRVNTSVSMLAGHTLILAGDFREENEASTRGVPKLMNSPLWGPLFRRNEDQNNETELVFLITPRFIGEVDPSQVPVLGPGQPTVSGSNHEFYANGYLEVPRCADDCPPAGRFDSTTPKLNNLLPPINQSRDEWEQQQAYRTHQQQLQQEIERSRQQHFRSSSYQSSGQSTGNGLLGPRNSSNTKKSNGFWWPK